MKAEGRTIGDLIAPRREKAIPSEHPDLPYVGLEHIEAHSTRLLGSVPATQMRSTANRFYSGDVLYSRLRPYLNKVWHADRDGLCSSEFIVLPGNGAVDGNFLRYRLNSSDFVRFANSLNAGDRPRVDFDQISSFILPTFSLAAQRAAVAEIEKQFTRLEAGTAALRRVQANLKRYRAAVLKVACEGRLVPIEAELAKAENRKFETGEELLTLILNERRQVWQGRGKYKEPAAPNTTKLYGLPDGWAWASIEQISTKVVDGVHKKPNYVPSGIPFVTVRNLTAGTGISFEKLKYITPNDHEEFIKRANPEPGDILISKDGTLGVIRVINTDVKFSIFVSVAMVKPVLREMSNFLGIVLSAPQVQAQMVPKGSGLQHIHLEDLREDCVPIPPLAEQTRIAAEVGRRLSVVEELEAVVLANLQRATRLRQSILKAAFSRGV